MSKKVLVIGGEIAGVQSALDLADRGIEVVLVEESYSLPTDTADNKAAGQKTETPYLMPKLLQAASHPNITIVTGASVERIRGEKGDFKVRISQNPLYVNPALCASCGRCELQCPVNITPPSADSPDRHKAIHRPESGVKAVPSAYIVDKRGIAPCTAACPAGVNVQGYVALISQGRFTEALDLITDSVPFPRVLGRVCHHPCETACTRGKVDQPVSICTLKRFVADNNSTESSLQRTHNHNSKKASGVPRVAIIGAGPAGLSAARDLARMGHHSTVFEALPAPGGMITVGMPRFRLPKEIRQADIEDIIRLGIEIKTSTPIGKDLTLDDLKRQGYEAILIAVGAHRNQRLGIQGEGLEGVINSIALLQALNLKQPISVGSRVVVIGGGYTGIDSARTAVRLHCQSVLVVDRCAREDLPANPDEIAEAEEEGVKFEYLVSPVRIVGENGKVAGVEFRRMKIGDGETGGRRHTVPVEGSEFLVAADTVVLAAGQRPDLSFLEGYDSLTEGRKHIVVDPITMATKIPGIFAAGDAAHESGPMINAIGDGRRAAIYIDKYLRGEGVIREQAVPKIVPVEVNLKEIFIPKIAPQRMPLLPFKNRLDNFEEVELGFTPEMALKEAGRCLNCGGCSSCLACERACELNAIDHRRTAERLELEVAAIIAPESLLQEDAVKLNPAGISPRPGFYSLAPAQNAGLSQASAVAAQIMADVADYRQIESDRHKIIPEIDLSKLAVLSRPEPRIGVFLCNCGGSISEVINIPDVVARVKGLNGVAYSGEISYACTDEAAERIRELARQNRLTHVVLAACACCNLDQICFSCSDRRIHCKLNLLSQPDGISYEFVNIREQCVWVHHNEPEKATAKAGVLISAGVARARNSSLLVKKTFSIDPGVAVCGGGLSGIQAAANLAKQGFPTIIIRASSEVTARASLSEDYQSLYQYLRKQGATILDDARLINVETTTRGYQVTVAQDRKIRSFAVGAIIIDRSSTENDTALPPLLRKVVNNSSQSRLLEPLVTRFPGIYLCGTGQAANDTGEALMQGLAAAAKAAVLLSRGTIEVRETIVAVDPQRCRGCGTCVSVCPVEAISLKEKSPGVLHSQVDEKLCLGCGICAAHCPSGAISQCGVSDNQIAASLEAMLS